MKFEYIPNQYIAPYVRQLFILFRRLGREKNGLQPDIVWSYITKLLNIDTNIFVQIPEIAHIDIINKYVHDLTLPKKVLSAGHRYLITFIVTARDKLNERLDRFTTVFKKIVNESWNTPHPTEPSFYPAKYFVHELIGHVIYSLPNNTLKRKLAYTGIMAAICSKMEAHEDPEFWSLFTITTIVSDQVTPQKLVANINRLLPAMLESFDVKFLETVAKHLHEAIESVIGDYKYQMEVITNFKAIGSSIAELMVAHLLDIEAQLVKRTLGINNDTSRLKAVLNHILKMYVDNSEPS